MKKTQKVERSKLSKLLSHYYRTKTPEEYRELNAQVKPILDKYGVHPKIEIEIPEDLSKILDESWDKIEAHYNPPPTKKKKK